MNSLRTVLSHPIGCFSSFASSILAEIRFTLLLLLPVLLSGCWPYSSMPEPNYYYLNPDKDLSAVGRVALVELDNDSSFPQISGDVTEALYQALQKKQIFGLTLVRQNDPAWRSLQLDMESGSQMQNGPLRIPSTYTLKQMFAIRKTLKCDAILIGTITKYQPYPHTAVGLRLKLLDLKDGQLLWALEQIWDSADKMTLRRIKNYCKYQMSSKLAPLNERLMVVSPLKFIQFVGYEAAETLHPDKYTILVRNLI
ncbi:MAG: hypothetical protein ACYS0C_00565 [Planctomycetota bacterium]|jgi:hypothetical protein